MSGQKPAKMHYYFIFLWVLMTRGEIGVMNVLSDADV